MVERLEYSRKASRLRTRFESASGQRNSWDVLRILPLVISRLTDRPEETLKRFSAIICRAACEGDFFRKLVLAWRGYARGKRRGASLDFSLLTHWFAGLLWLMNAEVGVQALCA